LRQRVIDDKKAVVVDSSQFFNHFVERTRAEHAPAKVRHGAGVAAETASARSMEKVNHLHSLVVVKLAFVEVATGGAD